MKRDRDITIRKKEQNKKVVVEIHQNSKANLRRHHLHHYSTALPALSPITLITQSGSQNSEMSGVHVVDKNQSASSVNGKQLSCTLFASHSGNVNNNNDVIVISDDDDDHDDSHRV